MPIGKSSITKRVAKVSTPNEEKNIAPELVATVGVAPKKAEAPKVEKPAEPKKTAAAKSTTAKKATSGAKSTTKASSSKTTATKAATKKTETPKAAPKTAPKKETAPKAEKPAVETTVLANVAPETVEAVIGHKEDEKYEKVQIGGKMPTFLL